MKVEDAIKLLQDNSGSHYYPCYLPTLGREVLFRPLNVGEFKSLAKTALEEDDYMVALNALVKVLCVEDLDLNEIGELDKIRALITIKEANQIGENDFTLTCKECDCKFLYRLATDVLLEQLNELPKPHDLETTINHVKYKLTIDTPSLELTAKYSSFMKLVAKTMEEQKYEEETIDNVCLHMIKYSNLLYVRNLYINDNLIENFDELDLDERNDIMDLLPASLVRELNQVIIDEPGYDIMTRTTIPITCPKCKNEIKMRVDIADFFQT